MEYVERQLLANIQKRLETCVDSGGKQLRDVMFHNKKFNGITMFTL